MPSQSQIIQAMQMEHIYAANAINGTGKSAYKITYQFESSAPADDFSGTSGWTAWSGAEKNALRDALAHIETFLNVDFVEVSGKADADLSLGLVSLPGATAGIGGAWLSTWSSGAVADYDAFAVFDKTLDLTKNTNLILHELGHALGLDHPFEGVALDTAYDNNHYTVMSYSADPKSGTYNDAMMLYDVLALQQIWGSDGYNGGNTTYSGPRTANVDTIWDTGGTDTFNASAHSNNVTLDLRPGKFSKFGSYEDVSIAYGVAIERARGGSGNDTLIGNGGANKLYGNGGHDTIKGNLGKDWVEGGGGKDVLRGGGGNDTLLGGRSNDRIYGGSGNDTLEGGFGADWLRGHGGADRFRFRDGADRDTVLDFEDDVDTLVIVGMGSKAQVIAAATESNGHTKFDFGGGDIFEIRNITLDDLQNDLVVI